LRFRFLAIQSSNAERRIAKDVLASCGEI